MSDARTAEGNGATNRCAVKEGASCQARAGLRFVRPNGHDLTQQIFDCPTCGHAVSLPLLGDVSFLYEARDTQDFQPTARGLSRRIKEVAFGRAVRRLLRQLGVRPACLLDFGCGSGQFTRLLGDALGRDRVTGCDFFPEPPPELAGRPYLSHADQATLSEAFDTVTAFHVLEHDEDPEALLRTLARLTRQGGYVVVEVPNVACVWGRVFGRFWDAWYMPYHRQHFSRRSLRAVMERAGLEVLSCHDETVPTMGRTLANLFGRRNTLGFLLAGILLHPLQVAGERLTGEGSALRVIARKG